MAKLRKFTLQYNERKSNWELKQDGSPGIVKTFPTKQDATKGGVLEKAVGGRGSVKIQKKNGRFEEERTYGHSADPRSSRG